MPNEESLSWAGIILHFQALKPFVTTIKICAYNPVETNNKNSSTPKITQLPVYSKPVPIAAYVTMLTHARGI
jgi:hypothetical protein